MYTAAPKRARLLFISTPCDIKPPIEDSQTAAPCPALLYWSVLIVQKARAFAWETRGPYLRKRMTGSEHTNLTRSQQLTPSDNQLLPTTQCNLKASSEAKHTWHCMWIQPNVRAQNHLEDTGRHGSKLVVCRQASAMVAERVADSRIHDVVSRLMKEEKWSERLHISSGSLPTALTFAYAASTPPSETQTLVCNVESKIDSCASSVKYFTEIHACQTSKHGVLKRQHQSHAEDKPVCPRQTLLESSQ